MPPNISSAPEVQLVPALKDNYVFVIPAADGQALVVDPGESAPVQRFLDARGLRLGGILITHHHADHIGGVAKLVERTPVPVWAPAADKNRPWANLVAHFVKDGDAVEWEGSRFEVLELPGHTLDHVAYFEREHGWLFCGDVLFGLGCGRLFEGSPEQMFRSLGRIRGLPDDARIFCAHEYTETNLAFVRSQADLLPDTAEFAEFEQRLRSTRAIGIPSVPRPLAEERKWNPFLTAPNVGEFRRRRELRNQF